MANPSTGFDGAGTEVLRRKWFRRVDESSTNVLIDGVANHIYTVLNIMFYNQDNAEIGLDLFIYPDAASGSIVYLLKNGGTKLPAYGSFSFNDKIVLTETDELNFTTGTATTGFDAWITYIDQQLA